MSIPPHLLTPLALLCLGVSSLAHARDRQTTLGVRLVIVDSCDIHSQGDTQRPDGGNTRVACLAGTPYEVSLSRPTRSADAVGQQEATHAAAAPENLPAVAESSWRESEDLRDIPITTVIF